MTLHPAEEQRFRQLGNDAFRAAEIHAGIPATEIHVAMHQLNYADLQKNPTHLHVWVGFLGKSG